MKVDLTIRELVEMPLRPGIQSPGYEKQTAVSRQLGYRKCSTWQERRTAPPKATDHTANTTGPSRFHLKQLGILNPWGKERTQQIEQTIREPRFFRLSDPGIFSSRTRLVHHTAA